MGYIRTRTFCCCIPVRFGVFVTGLVTLLLGGLFAVAGWLEVKKLQGTSVARGDEIALYVHAVMFSLLAVLGGFGLIGSLTKQSGLVSSFGSLLAFHLGFSVITGVYTMVTLFAHNTALALAHCINGSSDAAIVDACHRGLEILKIIVVVAYCLTWLVELYGVLIVNSYIKQLREEEAASVVDPNATMTHYYSPQPAYAFAQPGQSYGAQG